MRKTCKRVLVVDDDADQLQTLCRGLFYLGIECIAVGAEAEARSELARGGDQRIDLLLVDLSAPGKPGARLVAQIVRSSPRIPVLVVTGIAPWPETVALAARGVSILRKPFTPDQLGRAIESALACSDSTDSKGDE